MGKKKGKTKTIMHYTSRQDILLVGEGGFSFALSLAEAFVNASNVVATSLDSKPEENIEILEELGCTVLLGINAHVMSRDLNLKNQDFDRIVFNFPQAVNVLVSREQNQKLVSGFLENAYGLLSDKGQVHITHKTSHPYNEWNITQLAEVAGFRLVDEVEFNKFDYPGYCNKRGDAHGVKCNRTFRIGDCSTYMFAIV